MRVIITFITLYFLSISSVEAQTPLFEIAGPNEYEVCAPWCQTFFINVDSFYFWEEVDVYSSPSTGITITNDGEVLSFVLCVDLPGFYTIYVEAFGIDANQNSVFARDSIFINAINNNGNQGYITSDNCPKSARIDSCLQACENSTVTYYYSASGQTVTGNWEVFGAISHQDFGTHVEVIWGPAGNGFVNFFPELYCEAEVFRCVKILPTPAPDFSSLPLADNDVIQLCLGQPLYLENLSQYAMAYEWTFGDGAVSDQFEPEHSYSTPGLYTLTLTALNVCDCSASKSVEIEVLPAPAPELSCVGTVCPDEKVRYVASTDGCQTYHWSVSGNGEILAGGGLTDEFIEIEWGAGPDGIIELLVEDCNQPYCNKPAIFRVPIVTPDGPIDGDAQVCSGELVTYHAPYYPGVVYTWSTSSRGNIISRQGTNAISIEWSEVSSTQNNESVHVSYSHCYLGCAGNDQYTVSIVPNLFIESESNFCQDEVATFSSQFGFAAPSSITSSWVIYDALGSQVWASAANDDEVNVPLNFPIGTFTIIATPVNGNFVCESQAEKQFTVTPLPEAPIAIKGDSFICSGLPYIFEIINADNYQTLWTITDGLNQFNYAGQIISHTFGNNPPHIIEAAHADLLYPDCQSQTIDKIILPATTAEIIGQDENCFEEYTIYSVFNLPGNIIEWRVEPVDMAEVTNKNNNEAGFYWTKDGNAQVIISVCGQDIIKNVIIHPLPNPVVNHPLGLCNNQLANISTTIDYLSQTWKGELGDIISTDSTTAIAPGFYSVEVVDENGCIGETRFEIEFYPTPTSHISTLDNTGHCSVVDPIELVANTDGINYMYQWYHENVPIGTNSPYYTASDYGRYHVVVVNQYGCEKQSNSITLFDYCGPSSGTCNGQTCMGYPCVEYGLINFGKSNIDCNTKQYFENSTVIIEQGSEEWDIETKTGLYQHYVGANIQHTHTEAGYYTIIYLARIDGFAYTDAACKHLIAYKDTVEVAARFEYHGACANQVISFEDLSTFLPDYGIMAWSWDFGDSNMSSDQHPTHTYTVAGMYPVQLQITSTSGCTSTTDLMVEVFEAPTLSIVAEMDGCEDNPIPFQADATQDLFVISWDFGDPSTTDDVASSDNTWYAYATGGNYTASLEAFNVYGCISSTNTVIEIFTNNLVGEITSSNGVQLCEGDSTTLSSPLGGIIWDWNTSETTEDITIHDAGYYDVIVLDDHGCSYAPDPLFIEFNPLPLVTINGREVYGVGDLGPWVDTIESCYGVDIELQASSNTNVSYLWNTSRTTQTISFTEEGSNSLSIGLHTFTVEVADLTSGCISLPAEFTVIVHPNPSPFNVSLIAGTGCSNTSNILVVVAPDASLTYIWSDGQEGTQIEASESQFYLVTATNEFGCSTESTSSIFINPSPPIDLIPSGCFIRCDADTICIPSINNVSNYEILMDGVVVESGTILPDEFIINATGSYEIIIETTNGCAATSEPLNIEIYPGFGHLAVAVFVDVNDNGIIDVADTLISNIGVQILNAGGLYDERITNNQGIANFIYLPLGKYTTQIDSATIPSDLSILISDHVVDIFGCDIEYFDTLALGPCENIIDIAAYLCPGDSVVIGDTTFFPLGDFNYAPNSQVVGCDTVYRVTVIPDTLTDLVITSYFDVNDNGLLDAVDTLFGPIGFTLVSPSDSPLSLTTNAMGTYFTSVGIGQWNIQVDTTGFYPDIQLVSGDQLVSIMACQEASAAILIGPLCLPINSNIIVELCPGDSTLIDGVYYKTQQIVERTITGGPCDTLESIEIIALEEMQINLQFVDACDGLDDGAISIEANTNYGSPSITWAHTTDTDFNLSMLSPQTYFYEIQDDKCSIAGSIDLGEYIFPILEISETDPNCPGVHDGQINITLASPELTWSLDGITYSTEQFTDVSAGVHTVYFTNGNCVLTQQVELTERQIDPFIMPSTIDLPVNTTIQLFHNYLDSLLHQFNWSPNQYIDCPTCNSPLFLGSDESVEISVSIFDPQGCEQFFELLIRTDQSQHLYIPTAFSPNNDNVNDLFKPFGRPGVVQTERLQIFDRWGNQVYEEDLQAGAQDIIGWDGTRNGDTYVSDLFIYQVDVSYLNGVHKRHVGEAQLIR